MMETLETSEPNETTKFIYKVCKIMYFTASPNYWFGDIRDMKLSKTFVEIRNFLARLIDILLAIFIVIEWGAFFTQHNLSRKQKGDGALLSMAHTFQYLFVYSFKHHRRLARQIFYKLAVELKSVHNDLGVEKKMIFKVKLYVLLHVMTVGVTVAMFGVNAAIQSWQGKGTFTTVIPVWPDINDTSYTAGVARVILYVIWCIFVVRIDAAYSLLIILTTCLAHQFTNLASYFHSLSDIFDGYGTQIEKARAYVKAFVVGIKCHIDTLWCVKRCQTVCNFVFSGQIIVNVTVLVIYMLQMTDGERTAASVIIVAASTVTLLLTTGFFMWSAGDITVEAAGLPAAMYRAGWQRCTLAASPRARQLLALSMLRAQQPVEMVSLGTMKLSYSSYVSIVKSSYSLFSVLY